MNIKQFIIDISECLNIIPPKISYDTSRFPTSTMIAQVSPSENIIYINSQIKSEFDFAFAIIHELRHLWQYCNDKNKYMSQYKSSNQLSIEEYNLQIAEIDANAYAALLMITKFGVSPKWNGLSPKVIMKIENRMSELLNGVDA